MAPAAKKQKLANGSQTTAVATDAVSEAPTAPILASEESKDAKAEATKQRRSLFIRSLPATATTESLTELFSDSYPIKHATAVIDAETKQCKGYGFVTFADAEDAQRAKEEFNGRVWQDKKLRIEIAEPRQREKGAEDGVEKVKPGKPEREQVLPPKLIVRNLPWSIKGSNQLEKLFQPYGKIKQAYVPKKGPGLMAGFGFVLMRGRKNAEKAIEGVNGKEVDGRTLAVDWAVEKGTYQGLQEVDPDGGAEIKEEEDEDAGHVGLADEVDGEAADEAGHMEHDSDLGSDVSASSDDDDGDDLDVKMDGDDDDEAGSKPRMSEDRSSTLFVRNLPFTCTDEDLEDFFLQFGAVRYARVVMDFGTERSRGTGFVCFYNKDDADACLRSAPRQPALVDEREKQDRNQHSILQNEDADPTGKYTMDGRVLQISKAVDKSEATKLTEAGVASRKKQSNDKRRLYLLSEGTISSKSKLWDKLSPSEKAMREASAKQRQKLLENNPSLNLSLTRLSVRNVPRSVDSKQLKQLAREAIVGFATDMKNGKRERLSHEELARGEPEMTAAEVARKKAGKGIVKQAKVVFESAGGSKVSESTGAGRSRGYGFIEFHTHRAALMGLRWLNGHAVGYQVKEDEKDKKAPSQEQLQDRKKRLIVEFAIENAQVVHRRSEREQKARERADARKAGKAVEDDDDDEEEDEKTTISRDGRIVKYKRDGPGPRKDDAKASKGGKGDRKRKRDGDVVAKAGKGDKVPKSEKKVIDEKLAKRNQIIGRKRAMRKARKGGK